MLGLRLLVWAIACGCMCGIAAAQTYPTRPVRFIVPQPPGGGADIIGRIVAHKLHEGLNQQVVVDNRSGAGGLVGTELVARAQPDGYTLLLGYTGVLTIMPNLYRKLPYQPLVDFAPISVAAASPLILAVHPSLRAGNLAELVALAKARGVPLNYGSPGNGSLHHLSMEWIKSAAGLNATHVPYKGVNSFNAVMAGEVSMAFVSVVGGLPHAKAGRVKIVAITSKARSKLLPETPTVAESGIAGFEAANWFGPLAPRGADPAIVARLHKAVAAGMQAADVSVKLANDGAEAIGGTPAEFTQLMRTEIKRWGEVVKASGMKVD